MRSFRRVSYWPGPFGPNGGLVTFSPRPSGVPYSRARDSSTWRVMR
jgi:hypothetical protein